MPTGQADTFSAATKAASFVLRAEPWAVREGRSRVRATLRSWGLDLDDDSSWGLTVVSGELLARGVRRAAGNMTVRLDLESDQLILEVHDEAPQCSRARNTPQSARDEDGWSLALLDAYSTAHGTERTPAGVRCWAVIRLPPESLPGVVPDAEHLSGMRWVLEPAGAALLAAGAWPPEMCRPKA
ncbi:ATP-binding protein [Streptomyces sp. SID5910]|uniref:ATP-binding protein n=1 Tax=Streptomyces sp. SID5910 TaxID=2690312 RepID=UPI00136CAC39|nr:ATP-binding protein [Streptomyces sp. SID5910]MYR42349.1 ATP-binding protein [Streptomyces sp. SID5910]